MKCKWGAGEGYDDAGRSRRLTWWTLPLLLGALSGCSNPEPPSQASHAIPSQHQPAGGSQALPPAQAPQESNRSAATLKAEDMVRIPGGTYDLGSGAPREGASRSVALDPFDIDRYPVTVGHFYSFVKTSPQAWEVYSGRLSDLQRNAPEDYPATSMTNAEASAYCQTRGKRLPTEAEYEAAARGSRGNLFPWGNTWKEGLVDEHAKGPIPVSGHPSAGSPYGLQDLSGNVFHWTGSSVQLTGRELSAPERTDSTLRIIKAGGWACRKEFNRTTFRAAMNSGFHSPFVGFRCVKPLDPGNDGNLRTGSPEEQYSHEHFDTSEGLRQLFSYELLPGRNLHPEMAAQVARVRPGSMVADVGSGVGYLSFQLSKAVGESGQVYAVDIDKTVLDFVDACAAPLGYPNIKTLHSLPADALLPADSFDEVYLLGTVHCLSEETWKPFMESCRKALKTGGLLVVQDNTSHPVVGTVASNTLSLGFQLIEYAGILLPAEVGEKVPDAAPDENTDLQHQPSTGYLFRIYRKI